MCLARRSLRAVVMTQDGKLTNVRRMAAGFMAGITEALVIVTPFEVVKIRLQQQKGTDKAALKYRVRFPQSFLGLWGWGFQGKLKGKLST